MQSTNLKQALALSEELNLTEVNDFLVNGEYVEALDFFKDYDRDEAGEHAPKIDALVDAINELL